MDREGDHGGQAGCLDDVERDERFLAPAERLFDDEIDVGLGGPPDLLLEHLPHRLARCIVPDEDVREADVAREKRAGVVGDPFRDRERSAVHVLEEMLLVDHPELLAVGVVRERLDDVGPRVHELAVQQGDELRVLEDDLRNEGARLQIAAALELDEVALGADHRSLLEPLEQTHLLGSA